MNYFIYDSKTLSLFPGAAPEPGCDRKALDVQVNPGTLVGLLVLLALLPFSGSALALDYRAAKSGDWSNARSWKPRGIPGAGDRITSLGRHTITVRAAAEIGRGGGGGAAVTLDQAGVLQLAEGARLRVHENLVLTGEGAQLRLNKGAKLMFAPLPDQSLQLQLFGPKQRIHFAGKSGERAEIVRDPQTQGHWFVASQGHRDSLISGAYGRICDALDPESRASSAAKVCHRQGLGPDLVCTC